ncbi:TetR family transcriptional regulator [Pseudonocardia spinosispora]|uniref:acyl-CoA-like ligand-binding transcription factor n=1 Tax=Pseudonocardia spinosispora TaxID=103441 RepID=UPI00040668CE|nr:TetR family transcriptional regulator [Pseudonocardia spinosispora]
MAGLRERKKAQTRAELQRHALRLFRAQGYAATTVDQIASAADVSRATFFRYFPSKEDVVLYDDIDPVMVEAFAAQPEGAPLLSSMRRALRDAFDQLEPEKRALEEVRMQLGRTVPELRNAIRERNQFSVEQIAATVAATTGRAPTDLDVTLFAGILVGVRLAAQALADQHPDRPYVDIMDTVFARLEQGVPLADEPIRRVAP